MVKSIIVYMRKQKFYAITSILVYIYLIYDVISFQKSLSSGADIHGVARVQVIKSLMPLISMPLHIWGCFIRKRYYLKSELMMRLRLKWFNAQIVLSEFVGSSYLLIYWFIMVSVANPYLSLSSRIVVYLELLMVIVLSYSTLRNEPIKTLGIYCIYIIYHFLVKLPYL